MFMFYHLSGELVLCEPSVAVIDCGGVGYKLTISQISYDSLIASLGDKVKLFTHLQVKEDGVELFGFLSKDEIDCFRLLISVSGVGPKAAMAILSMLTPDRLLMCIQNEDAKALSRAPGIGAKTAARIILELRDKCGGVSLAAMERSFAAEVASHSKGAPRSSSFTEAADALTALGYSRAEVLDMLKGINTDGLDTAAIISAALKRLAK